EGAVAVHIHAINGLGSGIEQQLKSLLPLFQFLLGTDAIVNHARDDDDALQFAISVPHRAAMSLHIMQIAILVTEAHSRDDSVFSSLDDFPDCLLSDGQV